MILAFDPSGNFNEGKGTSGWAAIDNDGQLLGYGEVDASTVESVEAHWEMHINIIDTLRQIYPDLVVVCEDYFLYANRAASQINSRFETPQLIGVLRYYCYQQKIEFIIQTAVSVKKRWPNYILEKQGYITVDKRTKGDIDYEACYIDGRRVVDHIVDALRHAIHYYTFRVRKQNLTVEDLLSRRKQAE